MSLDVKIVDLNVRGLHDATKRKEVFYFLHKTRADFICIQESHSQKEDVATWSAEWGSTIYFSHGSNDSRGVMILSNRNSECKVLKSFCDLEGRYVIMEIEINNTTMILTSLYAPNQDSPQFFEELFSKINSFDNPAMILVGDFNLVLDTTLDRNTNLGTNPKYAHQKLNSIMEENDLVDYWQILNPDVRTYSWHRSQPKFVGSRVDFTLLDTSLTPFVQKLFYSAGFRTDHSMISLHLSMDEEKRGPGYWKLNNQLLHNIEYVNQINSLIEEAKIKYRFAEPDVRWETGKNDLIEYSKKYAITKSKQSKAKLEKIITKIDMIQEKLANNLTSEVQDSLKCNLAETKAELELHIMEKARSAAFRSRAQWTREAEKSSKYFFSLEKRNYNKKVMRQAYRPDGTITKSPSEIMDLQKDFYTELYRSNTDVKFRLENKTGVKIKVEDYELMESPITIEELDAAVKSFPKNKAGGCDGLSAEFYQFFWSKLRIPYYEAIGYAIDQGHLHLSARRGIISLILKKFKCPLYLKCWRPLTMLSIDYKLLAKALATRLKLSLPYLISEDQFGFMEDRQISSCIRRTIDVIDHTTKRNISGYLLSLDFEKCFDKIEYIMMPLGAACVIFGFGDYFINMVNLLLVDFHSCTTNNGYRSDWISISRSTHQGCPLAPYLYLLCGETMAHKIKENSSIKGITIFDLKLVLSQFADDTQLFIDETIDSLNAVIDTLTNIEINIGLTVNYEKSSVHLLGDSKPITCSKPLTWDPGGPTVLGINTNDTVDSAYLDVIQKMNSVIENWYYRSLTLIGRTLIVNTLMGSLFVYKLQVHEDPSPTVLKIVKKSILNFLWKGKKA